MKLTSLLFFPGIEIYNASKGAKETIQFRLATVEQDQGALPKTAEHFGASGICNCWRCRKKSVHNAKGNGTYQTGYISGEAFRAARKTNKEARKYSKQVAAKKGTFFFLLVLGDFLLICTPCSSSQLTPRSTESESRASLRHSSLTLILSTGS